MKGQGWHLLQYARFMKTAWSHLLHPCAMRQARLRPSLSLLLCALPRPEPQPAQAVTMLQRPLVSAPEACRQAALLC